MTSDSLPLEDGDAAWLLKHAGDRVRQLRMRHGMTRRTLSQHARISERYLGQLEKGQANVTLGLLQRIATTLDESLSAFLPVARTTGHLSEPLSSFLLSMSEEEQAGALTLLRSEFGPLREALNGVALIGMRGAGKTTLGSRLAEACKVPFIRLSDVIQEIGGIDVGALLEMTGVNAYRRLEYQALDHIVRTEPKAVVEAGGGIVNEARTFGLLLRRFRTVWVKATPEEHMQRVIEQGDLRPMADSAEAMDDLKAILLERDSHYRRADHILDTSHRTADDCLAELQAISRGIWQPRSPDD